MPEPRPVAKTGRGRSANVYLVGPMGSGKTTLGRRVASRLGLTFIDCDQEIEAQTGASVNLIFDVEGEEGFREREANLIADIARRGGQLVATGGGAILRESNRRIMRDSGFVVWLRTSVQHQIDRLSRDRTRPLLQTPDRRRRLETLATQRDPLYEAIADLVFDSSHTHVRKQAERLSAAILERWPEAREKADETA